MALVDLQDVKDFLGLTGTSDDTRLQSVLDYALGIARSQLGDLSRGTKTVIFENVSVKNTNKLGMKHINIQSLSAINGVDTTSWTNGTEYLINKADSTIIIPKLQDYLSNDFGVFAVSYVAGWTEEEVPKEFKGIISGIVGHLYSQDLTRNISEEDSGPHKTVFEASKDDKLISFKKQLRKYIPNHLKTW